MLKFSIRQAFSALVISASTTLSVQAAELPTRQLEVNGFTMQYAEAGSGPLLVLIHGSFSDHRTWQNHIDRFKDEFRVVTPTMRYFGPADWDPKWPEYSDKLSSDDLAAFIKALDAGPAHLVGWSRGARVAHLIALRHPEVVKSAYLFEGAARLKMSKEQLGPIVTAWKKVLSPVNKLLKDKGPNAAVPAYIDVVAGYQGAYDAQAKWQQKMYQTNARTIPITRKGERLVKTCDEINASKVPTTLVIGTKTAPVFKTTFGPYQECFGAAKVEIAEGGTHGWPRVDMEGFVKSVKRFASKHGTAQ